MRFGYAAAILTLLFVAPVHSQDAAPTAEQLQAACAANNAASCAKLGAILNQGTPNMPRDEVRAAAYFKTGCDLNFAPACRFLGEAIINSSSVDGSPEDAVRVLRKSCDLNGKDGCFLAGKYAEDYLSEEPQALRKAELSYHKGCDLGSAKSCSRMAELMIYQLDETGLGDRLSYIKKGCILGDKVLCILQDGEQRIMCAVNYTALYRLATSTGYDFEEQGFGKVTSETILLYLSRAHHVLDVTGRDRIDSETKQSKIGKMVVTINEGDQIASSAMKAMIKGCDASYFPGVATG